MELFQIFRYSACIFLLWLIWYGEQKRRDVDGKKSGIVYTKKAGKIHDIQEEVGKLGYVESTAGMLGIMIGLSSSYPVIFISLFCAIAFGYSSSLYGNYWFQIRINRALGYEDINLEESPTWHSPRKGKEIKKFWYGKRRRYQRISAFLLGHASIVIFAVVNKYL